MSYDALNKLQQNMEVEALKSMSYEKINSLLRKQHHAIMALERKLEQTQSPRESVCSSADDIIATVFKYIDRMNDVADCDPADKILKEFTAEVEPILMKYVTDASR